MNKVTDFKPLKSIKMPGLGEIETSGLTVVVGPNSSGKSQFLKDINDCISSKQRDVVVADSIAVDKPTDFDMFVDCLVKEGYLKRITNKDGHDALRPEVIISGSDQALPETLVNTARRSFSNHNLDNHDNHKSNSPYLAYFGRMLVTQLYLQNRLRETGEVNAFDYETDPPANDIQTLYMSDNAKRDLLNEIQITFNKSVWVDPSRLSKICLRVDDGKDAPTFEQISSPTTMRQYRPISDEGDGLKSYVAICIGLLLGKRPVCLLDEPEMCLHPPQAYQMGRFIGEHATSHDRATFVATHSSHVLRGIIEKTDNVQILRLNRNDGRFMTHYVSSSSLNEIVNKPTLRGESILDGVFAQSVAIVEGDGDRSVYQAAVETLTDKADIDIHFSAVGGTGGFADTSKFYRSLNIPVVVIGDLDLITDDETLKRVVGALCDDATKVTEMLRIAKKITDAIKTEASLVDVEELKSKLKELAEREIDLGNGDDATLRKELRAISNTIDRKRRIKTGGIDAIPETVKDDAASLLESFKAIGLFVVPVGELEGWLTSVNFTASKFKKAIWAMKATARIRELGPQSDDIWEFVRSIGKYLSEENLKSFDPEIQASDEEVAEET